MLHITEYVGNVTCLQHTFHVWNVTCLQNSIHIHKYQQYKVLFIYLFIYRYVTIACYAHSLELFITKSTVIAIVGDIKTLSDGRHHIYWLSRHSIIFKLPARCSLVIGHWIYPYHTMEATHPITMHMTYWYILQVPLLVNYFHSTTVFLYSGQLNTTPRRPLPAPWQPFQTYLAPGRT